jgi:hypothetical protein
MFSSCPQVALKELLPQRKTIVIKDFKPSEDFDKAQPKQY